MALLVRLDKGYKEITYHNYFDLIRVLAYFRFKSVTLS